jgi:hypothetical protein
VVKEKQEADQRLFKETGKKTKTNNGIRDTGPAECVQKRLPQD